MSMKTNRPDREHILAEIRRVAAERDGRPPGKQRFSTVTGIRESDWGGRYWARWGDALKEAGFEPNEWATPLDEGAIFEPLILFVRELGRMPTVREAELRRRHDADFPSAGVFRRLGPRAELVSKLETYCRKRGDCEDVLKALEPLLLAKTGATSTQAGDDEEADWGYVYLLKSGRHYKVGRTNSAGRRERELAIQLPERAVQVHAIRTDDPTGIERYWHDRFAARRKNGEWFELTASDVSAFRRRKFM